MRTERLFDHPDRLRIAQDPPEDALPPTSTSYFWTADDIRASWRATSEPGYTTFASPVVDIASMDRLESVVVELERVPAGGTFSLLWSSDAAPSPSDFLRNRREVAVYGDVPRRAFVLRGEDIARTAIGQDAGKPAAVRFLFLRFPRSQWGEVAVERVTVLSKADALAGRSAGQVRYAAQGETRRAAFGNGPLRLDYETSLTEEAVLRFGVHAVSGSAVRVDVNVSAGARAVETLLTRDVAGGSTWQDVRLRLPRSPAGTAARLRVALASRQTNDTVLLSEPTIVSARAAHRYPNVILYVMDGLRADRLGAYGHGAGTSPFFDSLARRATLYRNCQAQAAWTKPSIASLLTSLHPTTHAVGERSSFDEIAPDVPTLPERMRAQGYLTAQFTGNAFASTLSGLDRGFDAVFSPDAFATEAETSKVRSDAINRRLLPWIEEHAGERFFAYVHSIDTHPPFAAPRETTGAGSDGYDDAIRFNDTQLRLLYEKLVALGLAEDTLLVVTADHGEAFGEHGRTGHGLSVHREEMHVPLLVLEPGLRASVVDAPVQSVDVMPTILEHCGIAFDRDELQGRSLVSASKATLDRRTVFSTRFVYPEAAELPDFFGREHYAASRGRYKLIATREPGMPGLALALFDVAADPGERSDVQADHPEALASLHAELLGFLEEQARSRARLLARSGVAAREAIANTRGAALPQDALDRLKSLGYLK